MKSLPVDQHGPRPARHGASAIVVLFTMVFLAAVAGGALWYFTAEGGSGADVKPVMTQAIIEPFDHIVLEQGEVESSSNVEIICEVKSRNSSGTAILWVIDEGTVVKKGDLLVQLDKSALEQELKQQKTIVNSASAAVISAKAALEQAKVAKDEYEKGTFAQEQKTIESEILTAEETLNRAKETAAYSQRLTAQGFQTTVQLKADQFRVRQAEVALNLALQKLETLQEITRKKMLIGFEADIETAQAALEAEQSNLMEEQEKLREIEEQIGKCDIYAPEAGQVVHANQFSSRGGNAEFVVEPGATVRERQAIIRLPDTENMRVKAKINESQVSLVRAGMPVAISLGALEGELKGVVTKVNKYAEPGNWFSSSVKEYLTFVKILNPPDMIRTGMTAEVRIFVNQMDAALQIPVQAVHEYKGHFFCLVTDGPQPASFETREIAMGFSNDKTLTVESGLQEGEWVVMNPRRYLNLMDIPEIPDEPKVELTEAEKRAAEQARAEDETKSSGGPPGGPGGFSAEAMVQRTMEQYDGDSDGKLSKEEIAAMDDRARGSAEQADTNGDGEVDQAELTKRMEEVVKMIQQRMQQGGGGFGGPGGGGPGGPGGGGRSGGPGGRGGN